MWCHRLSLCELFMYSPSSRLKRKKSARNIGNICKNIYWHNTLTANRSSPTRIWRLLFCKSTPTFQQRFKISYKMSQRLQKVKIDFASKLKRIYLLNIWITIFSFLEYYFFIFSQPEAEFVNVQFC